MIKLGEIYLDIIQEIIDKKGRDCKIQNLYELSIFNAYLYFKPRYFDAIPIHIADEYMPLHKKRKAEEREQKINEILADD